MSEVPELPAVVFRFGSVVIGEQASIEVLWARMSGVPGIQPENNMGFDILHIQGPCAVHGARRGLPYLPSPFRIRQPCRDNHMVTNLRFQLQAGSLSHSSKGKAERTRNMTVLVTPKA